jgi:hypothetical protein
MTASAVRCYFQPMMKGLQQANAFVIQFRDAAASPGRPLSGRVEHVSSGRTANFRSLEELPKLLLLMWGRAASDEAPGQ